MAEDETIILPSDGACWNCGWLAQRHKASRELRDAEIAYRHRGYTPASYRGIQDGNYYDLLPVCTEAQIDFPVFADGGELAAIFAQDRQCKAWAQWRPGITPKELRAMLDRQKLIEWQADREDKDRQWRDDQRRSDHRWRALELAIIGVIGVLMAGAFTILGAFIERGSFP